MKNGKCERPKLPINLLTYSPIHLQKRLYFIPMKTSRKTLTINGECWENYILKLTVEIKLE